MCTELVNAAIKGGEVILERGWVILVAMLMIAAIVYLFKRWK